MVGATNVVSGAVLALGGGVFHGVLHTGDTDVDAAIVSVVGREGDALHLGELSRAYARGQQAVNIRILFQNTY